MELYEEDSERSEVRIEAEKAKKRKSERVCTEARCRSAELSANTPSASLDVKQKQITHGYACTKQVGKQVHGQASRQPGNQASKQVRRQAGRQAGKLAGRAIKQANT